MKKAYLKPELEVMLMDKTSIMAASGPEVSDELIDTGLGMESKPYADYWGSSWD